MAESETSLLSETQVDNSQQVTQPWYGEENKELVETKGWKTGDDAVNSYRDLEKSMGSRLKMPTPESSAEEIRAFYQKTGCPENPEGYEIPVVEGAEQFRNENIENNLKQIAHAEGVSKQAFESIVKGYYDQLLADTQASRTKGEAALRQELGAKYDEELAIGRRFCDTCSDEFRKLLDDSGLGNSPIFIKEFIAKGKQTMADTLIRGTEGERKEGDYVPQYKDSPDMYATGDDDESKKARAWFEKRGHKY